VLDSNLKHTAIIFERDGLFPDWRQEREVSTTNGLILLLINFTFVLLKDINDEYIT
jgi:hypothetical protein